MSNTSINHDMDCPYSFHSKSINRSSRMWLYVNSVSDCFDEAKSISFFLHDLPFLEMEAYQNYQNN